MAIRQVGKTKNSFDRLATGDNKSTDSLQIAALFSIDSQGNIQTTEAGMFLLNPTSFQENKDSNWAAQTVPGNSDPVLQWISGGARTVTFEALVTNDIANFSGGDTTQKPGAQTNPLNKAKTVVANIAAQLFNVSLPALRNNDQPKAQLNLDISNYLNYYRSLLYPVYDKVDKPNRLRGSPPLLVLITGTSISKLPYGLNTRVSNNQELWVLTNLQINITKMLPNLAPMEATVTFSLTQYNIRSFDRNRFLR